MNPLVLNLSKSELFQGVRMRELELISESTRLSLTKYKSEEIIRSADQEANSMYLILEGSVKGVMEDIEGHVYQVEEFGVSELTAPANLFSQQNFFPVSLIAKTDCRLLEIDKKSLLSMFKISAKLEENFLKLLSNKVLFLANKLWENQFYSIGQKIYSMVYKEYKRQNSLAFDIEHTHEELSQKFGVTRPSLSRSLITINKEGIIKCNAKRFEILSLQSLEAKIKTMN